MNILTEHIETKTCWIWKGKTKLLKKKANNVQDGVLPGFLFYLFKGYKKGTLGRNGFKI